MPTMQRPSKKVEKLFEKVMGEPKNMDKKIKINSRIINSAYTPFIDDTISNSQSGKNSFPTNPRETYEK